MSTIFVCVKPLVWDYHPRLVLRTGTDGAPSEPSNHSFSWSQKQDLPVLVRFNLEGKGCVVANGFADVIAAKVNLAEATNAWNQNETYEGIRRYWLLVENS